MITTIGIIGLGFVGRAVEASYSNSTIQVLVNDPKIYGSISIDDMVSRAPSAIFVCVPTPEADDGACDVSILSSVLSQLDVANYHGIVICKSTAPASTYNAWRHSSYNIVYSPEFLRAVSATEDYQSPTMLVFGGEDLPCHVAYDVMQHSNVNVFAANLVFTDITTAVMIKYSANAFLATKVIFSNEMKAYCEAQGGDWGKVTELLVLDTRLGPTHWQVPGPDGLPGYGGACFPKDVQAVINNGKVDMPFLKAVHQLNLYHRKTSKK